MGEELIDPHRNMGRVILIACLVGAVATAFPVIAAAWSSGGHPEIFRSDAPFSALLTSLAGPIAGKSLSAAVALAVFNALIAHRAGRPPSPRPAVHLETVISHLRPFDQASDGELRDAGAPSRDSGSGQTCEIGNFK
ncbi:MAG: hypothetical protein ACREV7_10360 [Steroidobacteraceae bacterium]